MAVSMYCLQNANKIHRLQSVNSRYCLQNVNKMHCLQGVSSVCCLQRIKKISVTTVQQDLPFLCKCLLKTLLVALLICWTPIWVFRCSLWTVNKFVHPCRIPLKLSLCTASRKAKQFPLTSQRRTQTLMCGALKAACLALVKSMTALLLSVCAVSVLIFKLCVGACDDVRLQRRKQSEHARWGICV